MYKVKVSRILCLCLGFSLCFVHHHAVFADRILEGLWLGPIDCKQAATVSLNQDWLEDVGGEDEIGKVENGPAESDKGDKKGKLKWEVREGNMADQFDVDQLWGDKTNHTAYFYLYIESKKKLSDVDLWLGSDDTLKVWINGEVVHTHPGDRGITVDSDKITIDLNPKWNSMMAKIGETGGGWRFSANFPKQPKEIKLTTKKPKIKAVTPGDKLTTTWGSIKGE